MQISAPFRFYQVRSDDDSLEAICQRFKVTPEKIEREKHKDKEPLTAGEMLVIHIN